MQHHLAKVNSFNFSGITVDELKGSGISDKRINQLLDTTYSKRRQWLQNEYPMISTVLGKFPVFQKPKFVSH